MGSSESCCDKTCSAWLEQVEGMIKGVHAILDSDAHQPLSRLAHSLGPKDFGGDQCIQQLVLQIGMPGESLICHTRDERSIHGYRWLTSIQTTKSPLYYYGRVERGPLKKPSKDDYTVANAWRPISLLATLGKVLESVIAERISYAVETYGLLPTNDFGARKQRSAAQALLLLQEQIYAAWRGRKIVSLISFDVKGAYNGVCKERLLQRMKARGIPEVLCRWVEAFCSERTASIQINGQASETT